MPHHYGRPPAELEANLEFFRDGVSPRKIESGKPTSASGALCKIEKLKWLGEPATTHGEPPFMFFYCSLAIKTYPSHSPAIPLSLSFTFLTAVAINNPAFINLSLTHSYLKP
jgi:hypothetical protein